MIAGIIDCGYGNIASISGVVESLKNEYLIIQEKKDFEQIDCLILPGVGNYKKCKELLDKNDFSHKILESVNIHKKPILGICIGMQLLGENGEEGELNDKSTEGLGLIKGKVVNLNSIGCEKKLPHVGWNDVNFLNDNYLVKGIKNFSDFYFVHSFALSDYDKDEVVAISNYDIDFPVIVNRGIVWGTQFHPEKSSKEGKKIIQNFLEYVKC